MYPRFGFCILFAASAALLHCPCASANDAGISMGGAPRLLGSHPSVRMASEHIDIHVTDRLTRADCRFEFENRGDACTVRMGFPDRGYGASDPDEEEPNPMRQPPHTTFTSFISYVGGRVVATRLVRGAKPGEYWHTKTVRFPAHSITVVRDVYSQSTGGGIAALAGTSRGDAKQVAYVLHTGASWHGTIGKSVIVITLENAAEDIAITPVLLRRVAERHDANATGLNLAVKSLPANAVVWKGPCAPEVSGKTLTFVRTNWRPTPADDVELTFNYRK